MRNDPLVMMKRAKTLSQIADALTALGDDLPQGWLAVYEDAIDRIGAVSIGDLYYLDCMRNPDGSVSYITHDDGNYYTVDCDACDAPPKVRKALGL